MAIRIVTEEYPPYNFTQNGAVQGVGTDVVRETLKIVDIEAPIEVLPWARAYKMALENGKVPIYTISRTPERERLFKWVGVITPVDQCVFALKAEQIHIAQFDDLKRYEMGAVIDDVQEQYLLRRGFPRTKIQSNTTHEANFRKLLKHRIDLWAVLELTAYYLVRENHYDPETTIEKVFCMEDLSVEGDYMAFSNKTADVVVEKFQRALREIKSNGTYAKIIRSYQRSEHATRQ
ncbi:MAG: transporter substrate-binding domain-containing protein [Deltaproteobacteria bacterium]|nr:transporter substrate-binding domain-containing protein [Deltaproteobacteria bacterium]